MTTRPSSRPRGFVLPIETLPLDSIRHFFTKTEPEHFRSLCSILVSMAHASREDALTLLLGLAYRNRHDVSRMLLLVRSVRGLRHPEVIALLASEFTRVPSQPSSRTYLTTVLESLEVARTQLSRQALFDLAHDPRVGNRYRQRIIAYLETTPPPQVFPATESTNSSGVNHSLQPTASGGG